jgi:hypothetical protein
VMNAGKREGSATERLGKGQDMGACPDRVGMRKTNEWRFHAYLKE